jgi:predicted nucleotidyltransferase
MGEAPVPERRGTATTVMGDLGYTSCVDRDRLAQEIAHVFAARNEDAAAVYLFGSVARGEAGEDSDVDVAVLCGKPVDPGLAGLKLALAGDLEERLGRRVDLVVLDHQPPDLVHRVLRDGLLVLENDRSARIRFEVTARNEYFDVLPMLRRYRRPPGKRAA